MTTDFPLPQPQRKADWTQLSSGSLPFLLAQHLPTQGTHLILTADNNQAHRLHQAWQFFRPQDHALFFPDWETLPYEHFSPHQDLVSERLSALWQLKHGLVNALFVPVATAMQYLPPPSFLLGRTFRVQKGMNLPIDTLRTNLVEAGYHHVSNVLSAGEFAVRGGMADVFPMGGSEPYRLEWFDNEIDSIRTFNPESQRSLAAVDEIRLLPAHEFPTDAPEVFRRRFREEIEGDPSAAVVYNAVGKGQFGAGAEYYLPLFFDEACATLFDYAGENALIVCAADVHDCAQTFWADANARFRLAQGDSAYPPLPPARLWLAPDRFAAAIKPLANIRIRAANSRHNLPEVAVNRQSKTPLAGLQQFCDGFDGRVLVCADSLGRRETMGAFFRQQGLHAKAVTDWQHFLHDDAPLMLAAAPLAEGFQLPEQRLAVVTESELYQYIARTPVRRRKHAAVSDGALRDLAEISVGDPVVHQEHGIGRYAGLVNMDFGDGDSEMMLLEYAGGSQLYVPVAQLHLISRYAGGKHENVSLHKLGNSAWGKAKRKAAEKARDTAAELLDLYARRAAQQGYAVDLDVEAYQAFADGFGYEETEDQAAAIAAVLRDLSHSKPMDRLVCGDVGFGKTEVALRAAFAAVMGGRQVAVLAPTTLLVEQHAKNFAGRFADFPVKVGVLSRFNQSKETQATLAGMADGTVDIVIGTHKLIQDNIAFKNLGLVIIDEEHRFGVRQKEQLKQLRANVDLLTLTATPIPRTLSMALDGLRDFSLIATAPSRRLAVKTFVKPFSEAGIREAVLRELKRGGQVFFLHNEVETIENMCETLETLLPEARIGVAHGQLRERELEQRMRQFLQQQFNVLLCSTIIETGIDIPNANTIIINRSDRFGIAQLHQLRGRVGRSHHQAYAYLLTPESISKDAEKRLDAIASADELGAGFSLAMQDLEIRGAGEILGEGQSGDMMQVGLTLYTEMLKQAVRDLKKGRVPDLDAPLGVSTEVKLHAPALLPESYCPDVHERLVLYKRLAAAETNKQINEIHEELVDRFGLTDAHPPVQTLLESHRIRLMAQDLGIDSVDVSAAAATLNFSKNTSVSPTAVIALMQSGRHYRMLGADKLRLDSPMPEVQQRIETAKTLLRKLKE
ncbi:transcription-repair coupling factor [Conchiformibius steedae]|uniref:Transcription-repair-coupling factor n=1 Tax=Conchiformibius steedae TaxID=153493 RepID=A0A3P2A9G3_9NEIS|nr:transcription-repair coupling factor [Conchiformibius steedae]RRD91608.1 transcription-repair coupling factor [Conchiformibius steedae]